MVVKNRVVPADVVTTYFGEQNLTKSSVEKFLRTFAKKNKLDEFDFFIILKMLENADANNI